MSAVDARQARLSHFYTVQADRAEHARVKADPNLSPEGKAKALAPLAARLRSAHDATDRALADLQAEAEGEVQHHHWEAVVRRAAAKDLSRANAAAGVAERESAAGLLAMASGAGDDATRHGILLGIRGRRDLEPDQRTAILGALAEPHRARFEGKIAVLVSVKHERLRHSLASPLGERDLATEDPIARLTAIHVAQQYVDPGTGATVSLSDDAVKAMLAVNGYPRDIGHEDDE